MRTETRLAVGRWVLAIGVTGAVLAIGSLDRRVMCVVALVMLIGTMLLASASEAYQPRDCASMLVVVAASLLAFSTLQAIPIPATLARALSPHAADIWARCLRPLGEAGPRWHPLSVDPPSTHLEILRGATYLVVLIGALAVAHTRHGARSLVRVLIASGALLAVASVIHVALGLDKVYGIIRPKTTTGWVAPLLNSNHAGGYVNISLMLMGSAVISKAPVIPRFLAIIGTVSLVAFELWDASRGAVGTMLLGLFALFIMHRRRGRTAPAFGAILPALLTLGGVGMLVLGAFESSARGVTDTSLTKLRIGVRAIATMVPAYPLFGAGRGTFEAAFPEFMNARNEGFSVFTHPENIVAQWLCEWGLVVTVASVVVLWFALRSRHALARGEIAVGPWVALVVVGLQNLVDFSLETPGVMIALVVCAAIVVSGHGRERRARIRDSFATHPVVVGALCALTAAVACGCAWFERAEVLVDAKPHVRDRVFDARLASVVRAEVVRDAMLSHPAEPYFPLLGALRATVDKQNIMPWIERTLERAPIYAPAHMVLARWLRTRTPSQARVEYRIASEELMTPTAGELLPLVGSFDDALESVPNDSSGTDQLDSLAALLDKTHPATRAMIDAEIERRSPGRGSVLSRRAHDALIDADSASASPWCNADDCFRDALAKAAETERVSQQSCGAFVLTAKLIVMHGDVQGGLAHLRAACAVVLDRSLCLTELATLATRNNSAQAEADIESLAREGCPFTDSCANNLLTAAELEQQRHNAHRALIFLRRAAAAFPDRVEVQERAAAQAAALGFHTEAAASYDILAAAHPTDVRYRSLAATEHERALQ